MTGSTDPTASEDVTVCVGKNLTVAKTAQAGFTRTYTWTIAKTASPVSQNVAYGTSGKVTYTVTAKGAGTTDSAWSLKGSVTVTNPNDWEAVAVTLADAPTMSGLDCTLEHTSVTVPAGDSVSVGYACTGKPSSYSGANEATATWDAAAAHTTASSASGRADVSYAETSVDKTLTITDTPQGGSTVVLGTATYPGPVSFTYVRSYTPAEGTCATYTNTATIKETGQSAQAKATVCTYLNLGDATMGYWRNKNGQALITSGRSTLGVCDVATWLRQFAPFQHLSATATCAGVASYVTGVINAATASGDGTAMLKGQLLATALDVFYSQSSLGNPKKAPHADIGSITIDTSAWKAAFGGRTSMTVLDMITYASAQYTASGGWYGGNKTLVTTAIAAFGAINNSQVLKG